jgi:hypothetical protein
LGAVRSGEEARNAEEWYRSIVKDSFGT